MFVDCSFSITLHTKEDNIEKAIEVNASNSVIIDYGNAEAFEADLNAGKNLEGKIVRFQALELHPDSYEGYNVWAGEHLNFISSRNPDIKANDIVAVKATIIESKRGSWFIYYEKVDNAIENESTIKTVNKTTLPTTTAEVTTTKVITTTTTTIATTTTIITTTQPVTEVSIFDIKKAVDNGDYSLVSPEFKATMDAYEAFYDDYIAFMNRYTSASSGDDFSELTNMMNDYFDMLDKMNEWSRKIDAIDENQLSPADDAYYLLVTLRIEQKLLGCLGSITY